MECRYDDELGNFVIVSETLYSTEELMAMSVPGESVEYMAKWAEIPMEEYFVSDSFEEASSSGSFALSGNGGSLQFVPADNEEYICTSYGYSLVEGHALNDVMGTPYNDAFIGITKDGEEFAGWTVYMADEITWSNEEIIDTQILCLIYNDAGSRGVEYVHLKDGTLVGEYMPTEQICDMTAYGEDYLAVAIWSE